MEDEKSIGNISLDFLRRKWSETTPKTILQKDIAKRLGKSDTYVSFILTPGRYPINPRFDAFAEFLFLVDQKNFVKNMSELAELISEELEKQEASIKDE